jgi:hypothetical protein
VADLQGAGLECQRPQINTDTAGWRPGGQVRVQIRCTLDLSALVISGLPGHRVLTADATVPLATYTTYATSTPSGATGGSTGQTP